MEMIDLRNELETICGRVRLLEMTLLGASASGVDFSDGDYLTALARHSTDIVRQLETLDERLAGAPA